MLVFRSTCGSAAAAPPEVAAAASAKIGKSQSEMFIVLFSHFRMLRVYNSLARDIQDFVPIRPGEVRMYVCGMTVYDYCHLGHARMLIAFDMVQRWLRSRGYRVTYVRNITDIDDKIIRRAVENGEAVRHLTDRMIAEMQRDFDALGIKRPTHEPRATDYVPQMLDIVGQLE